MTSLSRRTILATRLCSSHGRAMPLSAANAGDMRIAFGDLPGIESIQTLAAIERAKERGVNVELIILNDEDLAAQAIVGGQADVGIGAPYTLIQKVGVPIRMFLQISTLRFYPVVNSEFYKTWKDLDGQEIAVHARGSGTEAIMLLMAKSNGINFGNDQLRAGLGSAPQRAAAGHVKATIVDAANRRALEGRSRPASSLCCRSRTSTPPTRRLFANSRLPREERGRCRHARRGADPTTGARSRPTRLSLWSSRNKYKLLPDLGAEADAEIAAYYKETAEGGALPLNGGGAEAAADDFAFFTLSGQIKGDPATLKVEDFWDVSALDRAVAKLGKK